MLNVYIVYNTGMSIQSVTGKFTQGKLYGGAKNWCPLNLNISYGNLNHLT